MIRKALGTVIGGVLALALVAFVPNAKADASNKATRLTFNQPVELPDNVVLPAGTYWFLAPLTLNEGQIVQVFNADRTQLLDTIQTISTDRPNATSNTQLTFGKISNKQPVMLMSWYYPGDTIGHEFLYSPKRESQLSEGRQITVMARSGSAVSAG
jgi:hypothetical protein